MLYVYKQNPWTFSVILAGLVLLLVSLVACALQASGWDYPALYYAPTVFRINLGVTIIAMILFVLNNPDFKSDVVTSNPLIKVGIAIMFAIAIVYIFG